MWHDDRRGQALRHWADPTQAHTAVCCSSLELEVAVTAVRARTLVRTCKGRAIVGHCGYCGARWPVRVDKEAREVRANSR